MALGTKETKEKLARNVQRLRKRSGLSQEELAEKIKISRTHMGHIEQSRRSPSLKVLTKIANVFRVKVSDLF
jgi:DNA-binding XRE family transcriptional regulator